MHQPKCNAGFTDDSSITLIPPLSISCQPNIGAACISCHYPIKKTNYGTGYGLRGYGYGERTVTLKQTIQNFNDSVSEQAVSCIDVRGGHAAY
ncbi:hypothetical protein TNCV_4843441 [Trichonephila clavipes]|uniref:Uncharacterized protein n=1 Tax=Trichonephila clavipes TaxID=2585209 RepID=A0A8X7BMP2_TRICX|nr:hypothetical protein TNCV_4843441 [Trichonephila clavipes]